MKTHLTHSIEVLSQKTNSLQYFNYVSKVFYITEHILKTCAVKTLLASQYAV